MPSFFSKFPLVNIDILGNGNSVSYTDIFRFVDVNEAGLDSFSNYQWFEISDGERPDIVSNRIYGTPNYYWTFFIVNDRLKSGYKEWPLSSNEFINYIDQKYRGYGVAIIPPTVSNSIFTGENTFSGLDYTYSGLRVKRSISNENEGAKIADFDSRKFQLWVTDIQDRFFFSSDSNFELTLFLTNDDPESNLQWLKSTRDGWLKNLATNYGLFTAQYNSILNSDSYSILKSVIEPLLTFNASEFYNNGANVPRFYIDSNGEPLCPLYCVLTGNGIPRTNFEIENEINFERRLIRVIDPSFIRRFVKTYNEVLNSTDRLSV